MPSFESFINSIRQEYSGMRDMPRESLASSVKTLADDLYAKDSHFIFELVQNAEDNNYPDDENACLRFEVGQIDIDGKKTTSLIVKNNEVGFNEKNVRAICQVGKSTKKKNQGYIGEKGIGFKSVFRVTTCPYIFSNGFQFCLPENDKETGLGYIVPTWVSSIPDTISSDATSIILPLNKSEKDSDGVITALRDISPETILFLKKLSNLVITINLPKSTKSYNLEISKKVLSTTENSQLVELTCIKHETNEKDIFESYIYWVTELEFSKPPDVEHEKRTGIESRFVSIAIPLSGKASKGKLFAYLPVWDETGMPFLINADFLLVSSREGIREDEDWNIWLRDCVADAYTSSFLSLLSTPKIPFEMKVSAYASIPIETHFPFLSPTIDAIQEILSESECVLTLPRKELAKPSITRLCSRIFRDILSATEKLPNHLIEDIKIVCSEIEPYSSGLKSIGVKGLNQQHIICCFSDQDWLCSHELTWFVKLFRYLKDQKFEQVTILQKCKIVPVSSGDTLSLSCDNEQPLYLKLDTDDEEALQAVPDWLKNLVSIAVLNPDFENLIDEQKDSEDLKKWMQKTLNIYEFSKEKYCLDVISAFGAKVNLFNISQFIATTQWLEKNASGKFNWDSLPVKLSNDQTLQLSAARKRDIVVPELLIQGTGWQYIFVLPSDQEHFNTLHSAYSVMPIEWFNNIGIRFYPPFKQIVHPWYAALTSSSEAGLLDKCKRQAATSRRHDTEVKSYILPSTLEQLPSEAGFLKCFSTSIIDWLNTLSIPEKVESEYQFGRSMHPYGLYAAGTFENRGRYVYYSPSIILERLLQLPWLPTTKGYVKPSQAFLPRSGVKEILGDTVPYFEETLHSNVRNFLGIRSEVTVAELLSLLREHSGGENTDPELVERVYEVLDIRTERNVGEVAEIFLKEPLIFVPSITNGKKWFKSSECVWEDATDFLGNEYAYLQKKYAKRFNFFIDRLGVKERIDTECFANCLLKLQEAPLADLKKQRDLIERLYREIRPIALAESKDKPCWWYSFLVKAKIYSQKDVFCNTTDIIMPDDGFLKKMFFETDDVEFVWYPEDAVLSEWVIFIKAFDVPLLSTSITEKLVDNIDSEISGKNRFVTESAIKMIASWFKEKQRTYYNKLINEGVFEQLISIRESFVVNDLVIEFCIETEDRIYDSQQSEYPAFWDRSENILYYKGTTSKSAIAKALAKPLMRQYKDLANWIELVLGAANTDRIIEDNWNVPREINDLFRVKKSPAGSKMVLIPLGEEATSVDTEVIQGENTVTGVNEAAPTTPCSADAVISDARINVVEPEPIAVPKSTLNNVPELPKARPSSSAPTGAVEDCENLNDNDVEEVEDPSPHSEGNEFDYCESLRTAFTQAGLTQLNEEVMSHIESSGDGVLSNPARRASKLAEEYLKSIKNEPSVEIRRKETERRLLEPPNEAVRSSLYDWYQGKCQICGDTWPKRDGNPYFTAAYIVDRQNKRWLDNPGNSLCLCAKHFVQWRLATKLAKTEITEQIESLKLSSEGGDGELSLRFQLVDHEAVINLCEKHALALRELLGVAKNVADTETPEIHQNTPDDIHVNKSGRAIEIFRHPNINKYLPNKSRTLKQCPYCQAKVNENNFELHVSSKCPQRPILSKTVNTIQRR